MYNNNSIYKDIPLKHKQHSLCMRYDKKFVNEEETTEFSSIYVYNIYITVQRI